jgi:hypothetical protein
MLGLHETLAAVDQAEVPEALHQSLMAAIPAAAPGAAARTGRRAQGAGWQAWRLAALAAAVAVGALVLKFAPSIDRVVGQDAVGTIAAPPTLPSTLRIDRPEIAGFARLQHSGSMLVVELDVALHDALDVTAEHDGHTATVTGLQPARSGPQHVRLELPAGAEPGGAVSVRFSSNGRIIEEVALGLPGAQ